LLAQDAVLGKITPADFQAAMMALLKKAAANGIDHDKLVKVAAFADIAPEKVPATVTTPEAPEAIV
jgi:hypothetical protein